jgi:G3E family GTPase
MDEKPQVLILSGFLGSGKTTVLMRLVKHLHEKRRDDYRIAIIENEVGSASVDSSIIREAGYSVTEMLAGCICCTLIGQLVPAVQRLCEELAPDLIILEATGVATPETMRDNIGKYAGLPVRIVTIVDASRWERIRAALEMLLRNQLEPADVVCINKTDLVDGGQLVKVERSVREMNAVAPIVRMSVAGPEDSADLDKLAGE